MNDVTKLRLPLLTAVAMLSAAATGAGTWAVAADRIATHTARIDRLEAKHEEAYKDAEAKTLRLQRVEDALVNVADMVKEIREDVRDVKRRQR